MFVLTLFYIFILLHFIFLHFILLHCISLHFVLAAFYCIAFTFAFKNLPDLLLSGSFVWFSSSPVVVVVVFAG